MIYYLFEYLEKMNVPGAGIFQYISFRAAIAVVFSFLISVVFGKRIIKLLQKKQIGEVVRDLGLEGQLKKKGTPTMGGLIIIISILIPVLLFAKLNNVYVILMLVTVVWLGLIGFLDDYIKVFKKNKEGLAGKYKVLGQIGLGLIVGITLYLSDSAVIREKVLIDKPVENVELHNDIVDINGKQFKVFDVKSTKTTIPFFKNNEADYFRVVGFMGKEKAKKWGWVVFIIVTIFIITAVSNGVNMTDGLDGLATGTSAISTATLGILAYVSGNFIYADYLNIMYIPNTGELVVFAAAIIGATIGFLWFNAFPAQVFMGDTGSLTLGGMIAVFSIIIHKEFLIPVLCGIFLAENLSVIMQVGFFKYTKKRYGQGRRIFKMTPLHHHYQMKGLPEAKIVTRFWIVGIMLAVFAVATLKMR